MKYLSNLYLVLLLAAGLLQWTSCSEERHDYEAVVAIEDAYIDQLDRLIQEMTTLRESVEYGDKEGQYPVESRAILTDAIDDANRAVLLIKFQKPAPSENEKQRYIKKVQDAINKFKATIRTEDAPTTPGLLFVKGSKGGPHIEFGKEVNFVTFGDAGYQQYTIEFWVKMTKHGGEDQDCFLSTFMDRDGYRNGWMLYWRNTGGNGIYRATWGEPNYGLCEPAMDAPAIGDWHHIVFTYSDLGLPDNPNDRARLYLDGILRSSQHSDVGRSFYNSSDYTRYNTPMTAFGRYTDGGEQFHDGFEGYMKKIRIWKVAKDQNYVNDSFNQTEQTNVTGKEEGLVAAWDFTSIPTGKENEILDLTGRYTAKVTGTSGTDYKWERVTE